MSERMTSIHLPGESRSNGFADWGRKTPAEMIESLRSIARDQLAAAQVILCAPDDAFHVETYQGIHIHRDRKVLQKGYKVR